MAEVVFITGASSGLGRQMAREFANRGYDLALAARSLDVLEELKLELQGAVRVEVYQLDVIDDNAVKQVLEQAKSDFGRLDKILANAGIGVMGVIGEGSFGGARSTIEVNVIGAMATMHHGIALFRGQGFGHVVAISSVAAVKGLPGSGSYSASKAAINAYAESLSIETAREKIDVTVLSPGYIDTPINQSAKSRPFVVDVEMGGKALVDAIEKKVGHSYIPRWPWMLVAPLLSILPKRLFVGR